jgi:hypothetical protein
MINTLDKTNYITENIPRIFSFNIICPMHIIRKSSIRIPAGIYARQILALLPMQETVIGTY